MSTSFMEKFDIVAFFMDNSLVSTDNNCYRLARSDSGYLYYNRTEYRSDYLDETLLWADSPKEMWMKILRMNNSKDYYDVINYLYEFFLQEEVINPGCNSGLLRYYGKEDLAVAFEADAYSN